MTILDFFEKIIGPLGSLLAGIAAICALYTWRKQLKYEKRYEAITNLEEAFIVCIKSFHKWYYPSLKFVMDNPSVEACSEICQTEEFKQYKKDEIAYRFVWREAQYFLKKKEIDNFKYEPQKLDSKLCSYIPKRCNEIQFDGHYRLIYDTDFELVINKIFLEGIDSIKNLREEKSNFFTRLWTYLKF